MNRDITTEISELELHIFTLGCWPMGESIFAVIWNRNSKNSILSFLFDCFETNKCNRLTSYLDRFGIEKNKLDFIVWTHPDYDHSVGYYNILKRYVSKDTVCILPEGMSTYWFIKRVFKNKKFGSKALLEIVKSWMAFKKVSKKYNNVERVSASKNRCGTSFCKCSMGNYDGTLDCSLEILTPMANTNFKKLEINRNPRGNDISISALLKIGDYGFVFGGDAEDENLKDVNKYYFSNLKFIKVPHHASKTSAILPQRIKDIKLMEQENDEKLSWAKNIITVSTSFKQGNSNLPDLNVLELYKPFSSDIILTKNNTNANKFGLTELCFNLCPFCLKDHQEIADASIWYKSSNCSQ